MHKYQIFCDIDESTLYGISAWLDEIPDKEQAIIEICSHGGLVFYGNAVYQKLIQAQKRGIYFTCKIWGVCASSAADIALVCDRIEMAKTAAIMIHSAFNPDVKKDEGINIANDAQLAVIHKRLPNYTTADLKKDRWFQADEALKIGLIDSIFNDDISISAKLAAKYIAAYRGVDTMNEEQKKEVVEEVQEVKEDKEDQPSMEDLFEQLVERVAKLEERIAELEKDEPRAACDDDKQNARFKAIQAKIEAICAPAAQKISFADNTKSPKAELEEYKAKHPDIEKYINEK